jgi:hypothetical protein
MSRSWTCQNQFLRSISHCKFIISIWKSAGTLSALTSNGNKNMIIMDSYLLIPWKQELISWCKIEIFYKYFFPSLGSEKCVILFHCSCTSHSQGFLLNIATLSNISLTNDNLLAVHSCIERYQCKTESYISSHDYKAKEKMSPFPKIIQFLPWVMHMFRHSVSTTNKFLHSREYFHTQIPYCSRYL